MTTKPEWKDLMLKRAGLKPGSQVAYIPTHAHGNIEHPDVQYGFVTSVKKGLGIAYVRYFSLARPNELRTKANSEGTSINDLYPIDSRPQEVIDALMKEIEQNEPSHNGPLPSTPN